jgi:hypothetical protein
MTATEATPKKRAKKPPAAPPAAEPNAAEETQVMRAGWPYRFEMVPTKELVVDEAYQRPLTTFWVEVRDHFDPALVGTLIVSERKSGTKSVIDGQTRLTAMIDVGVTEAPCLIYENLTRAQEAELFAALQRLRRGMRTYHRFRAELFANNDQAKGISTIATNVGFELGTEEKSNTLQSITALEKAYRVDPEHLKETLEVIRDVWGIWDEKGTSFTIDPDAVSAQIINGISAFIRKQERLDMERLVNRLQDVTPRLLINRAAQIRDGAGPGTGAAGAIAQAILNEYMRRKRGQ